MKNKLTYQEFLITAWTLRAKSQEEISKELKITVKTVKFHMTAIYKKYKVKNKYQLMSKFLDKKLMKDFDKMIENKKTLDLIAGEKNELR